MHPRTHRLARVFVVAITSAPIVLGLLASSASAQDTTTTTSVPATTTTTVPATTTTAPTTTTTVPATTTTVPATTTTRVRPSTTTTHPSTTTTTAAATTSSSSTAWGWVLLAVVIVLAAVLVALLIARTRRQGREADWQRSVGPAVAAAELARDLVLSQTDVDDQQRRASVGVQVDEAVTGLERAAATAPDEASNGLTTRRAAESLRGLAFRGRGRPPHALRGRAPHGRAAGLRRRGPPEPRRRTGRRVEQLKAAITPPR